MTRLEQIMVKMGFDVSEASKVKDAMNKVKEGTKGGEQGIEGFNTKGREMHELINKIGASSPLLGSALKACFSPEAAGIALFIGALEFVKSKFEAIAEKIKELNSNLQEMWYEEQEAALNAQSAVADYQRKISDILDESKHKLDDENSAFERQLKLIQEIYGNHQKVVSAINEAAAADLSRARKKEDKALDKQEQRALAGAPNEAVRENLRKQFEAQKEAIDNKREYEDAATKRQQEKQADEAARIVERATQTKLAGQKTALDSELAGLVTAGEKAKEEAAKAGKAKEVAEAQSVKRLADIKKEQDKVTAEIERRESGPLHSVARGIAEAASHATGVTGMAAQALLGEDDRAKVNDAAKKKQLDDDAKRLMAERKKIEDDLTKARDKEGESTKNIEATNARILALKQRQKDLSQQIAQNEAARSGVDKIKDAELARMKGDLVPQADESIPWWANNNAHALSGGNDDFSLSGKAGRDYAARMGFLKPENKADGKPNLTPAEESAATLKDILGALGGKADGGK